MKKVIPFALSLLLTACSSTKVKQLGEKKYQPLAENAPVTVYDKVIPDLGYEKVCDIKLEANTSFTLNNRIQDYYPQLKEEARKCGANGVILDLGYQFGKKIDINATGIRVTSEAKKIDKKVYKNLSLATQSSNIKVLKKLLSGVNKKRALRAPSDTAVLDGLYYIYARKGLACQNKMVKFFKSYESVIPKFGYLSMYGDGLSDQNIIFCKDALETSYSEVTKKEEFTLKLNNHFSSFIKYISPRDKQLSQKLGKFRRMFKVVNQDIKRACQKSETSELCILKTNYQQNSQALQILMKRFGNKGRTYKELKGLEAEFNEMVI